jgi:hypothetical protein
VWDSFFSFVPVSWVCWPEQFHCRLYDCGYLRLTDLTKTLYRFWGKHTSTIRKELTEASVAYF